MINLLRRRNLLVHCVHLRSGLSGVDAKNDDLKYYYNQLDETVRNKLSAKSPTDELALMHMHLASFPELLDPICDLCLWGVGFISDMRKEKEWFIG